jgi:hypothetical protein
LSVTFLILACSASAQQIAVKNDTIDPVVEKKALDLLETVASRISSLKNAENRIALSCSVAESLWNRDEKRARALFQDVTKEMTSLVASVDYTDSQLYNIFPFINQQRQEVVTRMARRDPELALNFLRATRFPIEAQAISQMNERNLELYLSRMISARDPDRALQIARDSVSRGLSYELVGLLTELQRKNPAAAQSLYETVINRIKSEDLARNQELSNIACNLLTSFVPPQANELMYRDLLDTIVKTALSLSPTDPISANQVQNMQGNLRAALPMVEKYLPQRAQAFKQWSQRVSRTMDPSSQMYSDVNEAVNNGTVDDVLALAAKYPPEMRSHVYQQAAWKASNAGDNARARQIVNEFVSDPMQRRQILEQLDNQAIWRTLNENKLEEARSMLGKSISLDQRIQILQRMAGMLLAKDDKKGALECLNDARSSISEMPRGSQKVSQQFQLANAYAQVDSEESFAIIGGIVSQINELVTAAAVMDGFENRYLKNDEWLTNGGSSVGNLVTNLRQALAQLGRRNFDRAEALAEQLERPEIRLLSQVDIAQAALSGDYVVSSRSLMRIR